MTPTVRLTAAGFLATAVTFGPARMGFGLFLPAFRNDFSLSTSMAGLIASGGFLAFLLALIASAWLGRRYGPRACVLAGAVSASAGFTIVALATLPSVLATGIALAGASAGLCWAPFNDAAERVISHAARASALSVVSTGTSFGIVAAAGLALTVDEGALDWRQAWAAFALSAVVLAVITLAGLPRGRLMQSSVEMGASSPSLFSSAVIPLYGTALCFGMTNTIFLSFAADRVVAAGGLPGLPDEAASAVIFLAYGFFGVLGLATGRIEEKTGLAPLFCAIFFGGTLSLVLIGLAPTSWSAVVAAAGLHGVAIMMVSAVFSFWSLRLFPGRGTLGFTATLVSLAVGSVLGPALAGVVAEAYGPRTMFLAASIPPLAAALWFGVRLWRPRPRLPATPLKP